MLEHISAYYGHVNGNRFLVADMRGADTPVSAETLGKISRRICLSHFVDDFIVIEASTQARARMRVFGGDGREANFCGNGLLLTLEVLRKADFSCQKVYKNRRVFIETAVGIRLVIVGKDRNHAIACSPILTTLRNFAPLSAEVGARIYGLLIAGEPHVLVAPPDNLAFDFCEKRFSPCELFAQELAALISFPGGVNVSLVMFVHPSEISLLTVERGVKRLTASCGSAATAAAGYFFGKDQAATQHRRIVVHSPGGKHLLRYRHKTGGWWLSGQSHLVGNGQLGDFIDLWRLG